MSALVGTGAAAALRALFPEGELPDVRLDVPAVSPELRAKLEAAAAKAITRYPRRKGPGPN
eukprot:2223383-Karenia_brevis.AAC.1